MNKAISSLLLLGAAACASLEPEPIPLSAVVDPATRQDYTLQAGQSYYIDQSYDIGHLTVHGKLYCRNDITTPLTLTATTITVSGQGALFECGNEAQRFTGKLSLLLRDEGGTHADHGHAEAVLSVADGGTLRLYGNRTETFGWQRLAAPIAIGDTSLQLETPVSWRAGDELAIGPTGFSHLDAEERTIASVSADGRTVTVTAPFQAPHGAFTKRYSSGGVSAVLDERAEVANLSRNLVISVAGPLALQDRARRGAGVVIRRGGNAYVDGIELARGGKLGVMGEYPFHWHLVGEAGGQFLRNSSIHHSYQRCVTIHGTNAAEVSNNVCFNHLGHGFFFEQGNEVRNVLRDNLGMFSRRVELGAALLDSDMRSDQPVRFSAPATYWITNPDNDISGNVASGSEGTGFWMAFSQGIACGTGANPYECIGPSPGNNNVFPAQLPTLSFNNNVAHSAIVGITWDGAEDGALSDVTPRNPNARRAISTHYSHGPAVPRFDGLVAWKNAATGIYFRGNAARFTRTLVADNGRSLFFAYDQAVEGALVVGASEGVTARDVAWAKELSPDIRLYYFAGALIYDGPFDLRDVYFADFAPRHGVPGSALLNIGGSNRSVNRVQRLQFLGPPVRRAYLYGEETWADTPWTTALRDDGSLSGAAGLLVPRHPLNDSAGECVGVDPALVDNGLRCGYQWGVMWFIGSRFSGPYDDTKIPIKVERIERATGAIVSPPPLPPSALTSKSGMIIGQRYRYRWSVSQSDAVPSLVQWTWQPEVTALSPVIEILNVAANRCRPSKGAAVASLAALDSATSTAYRWEAGHLYMRVAPGTDTLLCQ